MFAEISTVWRSLVSRFTVGAGLVGFALLSASCEAGHDKYPMAGPPPAKTGDPVTGSCANPREGCACPDEGREIECGETQSTNAEYRTCAVGTRVCTDGAWSACAISELKQQAINLGGAQRLQGNGTPQLCAPGYDPCDPYCNQVVDTPDNTTPTPPGFQVTPTGLTLVQTGIAGCRMLTLAPTAGKVTLPGNVVTVTGFTASTVTTTPTGPVTFVLTIDPPTCVTAPFTTTWTTNRPDRALISGTNNTNGSLAIAIPYAGPIQVTAYAQGLSATTTINVKVNTLDATAAAPNVAATAAQKQAFHSSTTAANWWSTPLPGTAAAGVNWLYPYANTYFPLGLPAPIVQYWYTNSGGSGTTAAVASTDRAVKVSLRYPVNSSADPTAANYADFNYSVIAKESNTVSQTQSIAEDSRDPQITIPQYAWSYFEQTARGNDADLVIQRVRAGVLEQETRRVVHPVDGQIKGTIYYSSYTSPQGSNTGAILKIAPGATSPTLAVQPSSKCTVCHSLNSSGTYLVTNTQSGPGTLMNQSRRFDMSTAGPSPTVLNNYAGSDTVPAVGTNTTVTQNGTGSIVTITGVANKDGYGTITISTAGARGTAKFNWTFDNQAGSGVTTAAGPLALGTTGLSASFANLTNYALNTTYDWASAQLTGSTAGEYWANRFGDRFTFGGPWGNGTLYMTHGGRKAGTVGVGDPNFRAPPDYSNFYGVANPNTIIPVTNWPSDMLAVTPRFSHDGTDIAFGYWGGSNLPNASGGLTSAAAGTRLAVADFAVSCTTPPCVEGSAGLSVAVSNARDLTPGVTERVAWPSFTPSGGAVVYQRQYRTAKSRSEFTEINQNGAGGAITLGGTPSATANGLGVITITTGGARGTAKFSWSLGSASATNVTTASSAVSLGTTGITASFVASPNYVAGTTYTFDVGVIGDPGWGQWDGWSPSHINSSSGALAELWLSNIPATSATPAVPTRLLALNGLNNDGSSYLPEDIMRTMAPPSISYHKNAGAQFDITQADSCGNTGTATNVYDYRLNYLPAFNPTEAGGYSWVVFSSRRMYGNIAYNDPWDAKPGSTCSSNTPPTKKLWVAAINSSVTPGADPSHPAFYLPGQELGAGNANAEWVNTPCFATGTACASNDDCCNATGPSPTSSCKVTNASTVPPTRTCQPLNACSAPGAACTTTADCCTGTCPTGGGTCVVVTPAIYVQQVYTREYVATCPDGTDPKWRYLEWQATIPTGTSIVFEAQTKATAGATYAPTPTLAQLGTASATTAAGTWTRSTTTVEAALTAAGLTSRAYLLVTMTFKPNGTGSAAPTLNNWRQIYDCVPAE